MKLNISYPPTGQQKLIEINDDSKLMPFMDKHMGAEVEGSSLGDEYKGYIFKISGGNDKQGFPMKQGVLTTNRVRLLLKKGDKCFRARRKGERRKKSVRGCITSNEICVLDLVIVQKGQKELAGITDTVRPRRLGPKRAGKIRKVFALKKTDDVRKYVVRRKLEGGRTKAPKIQRLVTPLRIARKKYLERKKIRSAMKTKAQMAAYKVLLAAQRKKDKAELLEKHRQIRRRKLAKKAKAAKKAAKIAAAAQNGNKKTTKKVTKKTVTKKEEKPTTKAAPVKAALKVASGEVKKQNTKVAPKTEKKVEKKTVAKTTPKVEKKVAPKVEKKAAPKVEKKAAAKVEKKAPAKAAPAPVKGKKPAPKSKKN